LTKARQQLDTKGIFGTRHRDNQTTAPYPLEHLNHLIDLCPEPFAEAAYQLWLSGGFIKNDEPQNNKFSANIKEFTRAFESFPGWRETLGIHK